MAMQPKNASDIITFTRSTAAWEWDWQGNYSEVAAGVMRIAHDPLTKSTSTTPQTLGTGSYTFAVTYQYPVGKAVRVSADANNWMVGRVTASSPDSVTIWVSAAPVGAGTYSAWTLIVRRGIRVEEQRTNLLARSGEFATAAWAKSGSTVVTPLSKGAKVDFGVNFDFISQATQSVAATTRHTVFVIAARDSGRCTLRLTNAMSTHVVRATLDTTARTLVPKVVTGTGVFVSATVTPFESGWDIYALTGEFTAAQTGIGLMLAREASSETTVTVLGAQLELGATPSSYIPTGASQVIRAADVPLVNTLAPWFNAAEGMIVVKAISSPSQPAPISETYAALRGASINDRIEIAKATAQTNITGAVVAGGVAQANMNGVTLPPNTGFSAALSYKANDFAFSLNGGAVATDNSGSVPVVALLQIGSRSSANQCNGIIEGITYYPRVIDVQQASA